MGLSGDLEHRFCRQQPRHHYGCRSGLPESTFGPDVENGLYRSSDGGQTWIQLNCGFVNSRVVSVRISPSNPDVAVVGIEGRFPSFTGSGASQYYPRGIFRTEDAGQNWTRVTIGPDDERNGFVIMHMATGSQPQLINFGANHSDTIQNLGFLRSRDMALLESHLRLILER